MRKLNHIYDMVMSGKCDNNVRFSDLSSLLLFYGFNERVKGDHFIYKRKDVAERINIQPDGNKAKAYQVKQVRMLFEKYGLKTEDNKVCFIKSGRWF